jgi:hypothetical protein
MTTAPVPITTPSPIVTPGSIDTLAPIQQPSPTIIFLAYDCPPLLDESPISCDEVIKVTRIPIEQFLPIMTSSERSKKQLALLKLPPQLSIFLLAHIPRNYLCLLFL